MQQTFSFTYKDTTLTLPLSSPIQWGDAEEYDGSLTLITAAHFESVNAHNLMLFQDSRNNRTCQVMTLRKSLQGPLTKILISFNYMD